MLRALLLALMLAAPAAAQELRLFTVGAGEVGGGYYAAANAICDRVNRKEVGRLRCSPEATSGSLYNLAALRNGQLDFALVQSDWQRAAYEGTDAFATAGPMTDLRSVMGAIQDVPGLNPSWITSKVGQNVMFGRLTDAAGGNTKRDLGAMMPEQYGGYGIVTSSAMPSSTGDLSDVVMAIFGDLRMGVILGDRRGMTMMVDPYSLSSYQQTKIISSERFDWT